MEKSSCETFESKSLLQNAQIYTDGKGLKNEDLF